MHCERHRLSCAWRRCATHRSPLPNPRAELRWVAENMHRISIPAGLPSPPPLHPEKNIYLKFHYSPPRMSSHTHPRAALTRKVEA